MKKDKFIESIPVNQEWKGKIRKSINKRYREGVAKGVRLGMMNTSDVSVADRIARMDRSIKAYENTVKMKDGVIERLKAEKKQDEEEHKKAIIELTESLRKERAIHLTENDIQKVLMDVYINSDLTKEEIAEQTKIDIKTINEYILGYSIPSNERLNKMSIAFGMDLGNYCIKQIGGVKNDK